MEFAFIAFGIGLIAAFAELLNRYNGDFGSIFSIGMSYVYILINGIAGIVAYYVIIEFDILSTKEIVKAIVAGTSALLILRSSFVNLKSGEKQIEIGLSTILQIFLNSANRSFDQKRSEKRLKKMSFMMEKDFEKTKEILPELCFNLMRDVEDEEKRMIIDKISEIDKSNAISEHKSLVLGVTLSEATNITLLKEAVDMLGDSINLDEPSKLDESKEKLKELLDKLGKTDGES